MLLRGFGLQVTRINGNNHEEIDKATREAFANHRFVGALLLANFLLVPLMVWLVTWPLSSNKALLVGALLVLLTPCIDYVVVFTHLGKGDSRLVLAATPF